MGKPKSKQREQIAFPVREDGTARIEVHVAGVCVRNENGKWKVLAGKRSSSRSLFPNQWECGGGQVRPGEGFKAAIQRQIWEEFGISVSAGPVLETYEIHVSNGIQRVIPGIRFLCFAQGGKPRLNRREFSDYRWLDLPPRVKLDWISGITDILDEAAKMLGIDESSALPAKKTPIGFHAIEADSDTSTTTDVGQKKRSHRIA